MNWLSVIKTVDFAWLAVLGLTALLIAFYFAGPSSGDEVIHAFDNQKVERPAEGVVVYGESGCGLRNADDLLQGAVDPSLFRLCDL